MSEELMKRFLLDLRHAVRVLGKSPGFAIVALLSLAQGTGANTAIFQLLNSVRMRMLPVKNPQELVEISLADRKGLRGSQQSWKLGLTNPLWEEVRNHQEAFAGMFAWAADDFNLTPSGEVRHAQGLWVSGDFFRVLGVQPVLGRLFTTADDTRGCGLPGAVISYPFWQREFGGDASDTAIRDGLLQERLLATLSNFFGFLAAVLASVGVYGVMSYMVLQRTNEIGVRLALGADRGAIMSLIMREAGMLLAVGLIAGTLLSLVVTRAASSLLFGVKPGNPLILVAVIAGLSVIVVGAGFLPTRRASRLDPMVALRYE